MSQHWWHTIPSYKEKRMLPTAGLINTVFKSVREGQWASDRHARARARTHTHIRSINSILCWFILTWYISGWLIQKSLRNSGSCCGRLKINLHCSTLELSVVTRHPKIKNVWSKTSDQRLCVMPQNIKTYQGAQITQTTYLEWGKWWWS
jgi:hypothetical protein